MRKSLLLVLVQIFICIAEYPASKVYTNLYKRSFDLKEEYFSQKKSSLVTIDSYLHKRLLEKLQDSDFKPTINECFLFRCYSFNTSKAILFTSPGMEGSLNLWLASYSLQGELQYLECVGGYIPDFFLSKTMVSLTDSLLHIYSVDKYLDYSSEDTLAPLVYDSISLYLQESDTGMVLRRDTVCLNSQKKAITFIGYGYPYFLLSIPDVSLSDNIPPEESDDTLTVFHLKNDDTLFIDLGYGWRFEEMIENKKIVLEGGMINLDSIRISQKMTRSYFKNWDGCGGVEKSGIAKPLHSSWVPLQRDTDGIYHMLNEKEIGLPLYGNSVKAKIDSLKKVQPRLEYMPEIENVLLRVENGDSGSMLICFRYNYGD